MEILRGNFNTFNINIETVQKENKINVTQL